MLTAYIIYTFVPIVLIALSYLYRNVKHHHKNLCIGLIIVIFSLIFGLRYNVGKDFGNYWLMLEGYDADKDYIEIIFAFINNTIRQINLPPPVGFVIYAFIQIYFFIIIIRKFPQLLPWGIFFYFSTTYIFLSLNVIRQTMAFSIILFSTWYVYKKNLRNYIICILVATGIHLSSIVFIPVYFVINHEYLKSRLLQIGLLTFCFVSGSIIQRYVWQIIPFFGKYVLGVDYSDVDILQFVNVDWNKSGAGMGYILWYVVDVVIIYYYPNLKRYFKHPIFIIWYNLFFIGTIFTFILGATYLNRINVFFENFKIVIYAIFALYLYKNHSKYYQKSVILIIFIAIMVAFYYIAISKKASDCAPYQFI